MARIRSVHPGLWTDEEFVSLTMAARLFLIGLWNEADDYGVFAWKPVGLKMRLAPADNVDPVAILGEIEAAGFIVSLTSGGNRYAAIRNFRKFQRPKNPSAPIIPVDAVIAEIIGLPTADYPSPTPVLPQTKTIPTENPPQMEDGGGIGKEDEEEERGRAPDPDDPSKSLLGRVMVATGINPAGLPSAHWMPNVAEMHVNRWRDDLGLTEDQIVRIVGESRARFPGSLPERPSAFDRDMRRFAAAQAAPRLVLIDNPAIPPPPRFDVAAAVAAEAERIKARQ